MSRFLTVRRRAQTALLMLLAGITTGGCVAAGLATAPLVSAVQLIGDRSVARTVGADIGDAWTAVEATLSRMAFRVEGRERGDAEWRLRGVADRVTVEARLERVTPRITRVTVRVETGGILADRHTAATIHEHIAQVVAEATGATIRAPAGVVPGESLISLEAEVRRLRTEMEHRRSVVRPPADVPAAPPALRVQPSAVVTVPLSAALPSAPGPVPATSVAQPVGAAIPIAAETPAASPSAAVAEPFASFGSGRTAPLRAADALVPVRPVSVPGSGK